MKNQSFAVTIFSTFVLTTGSLATGSLALAQTESTSPDAAASDPDTTEFTVPAPSSQTQTIDYSNPKTLEQNVQSFPGGSQADQNFPATGTSGSKPGRQPSRSAS